MLYIELFKKKIIKQLYNADCLNGVYHYEFIYKFESNKLKGNLYMVSPRNKTFFFLQKKKPKVIPKLGRKVHSVVDYLIFFHQVILMLEYFIAQEPLHRRHATDVSFTWLSWTVIQLPPAAFGCRLPRVLHFIVRLSQPLPNNAYGH